MSEGICTPWADPADGFSTEYSIYGNLEVDSLLSRARPTSPFSAWRRGDNTEFGVASSSGITIPVTNGASKQDLFRDVEAFLERERTFLVEAGRVAGPVQRGLVTTINLSPGDIPAGLEFPARLLALAGGMGVSWALMAFPPVHATDPSA